MCGSLATIAPPLAVRDPAAAQLLLPPSAGPLTPAAPAAPAAPVMAASRTVGQAPTRCVAYDPGSRIGTSSGSRA